MNELSYYDPRRYGRPLGGGPDCTVTRPAPPRDARALPLCPQAPPRPRCQEPRLSATDCWDCCMPGVIETRILRRPAQCVKPECHYCIPAVPCRDPPVSPRSSCNALCFDWSVEAPGPNDSYGLNGLNWHDWQMVGLQDEERGRQRTAGSQGRAHPGFSNKIPSAADALPVCDAPLECYSRSPATRPCRPDFASDVNYFRDWRCCSAKPPAPWRPPYKQWATGSA